MSLPQKMLNHLSFQSMEKWKLKKIENNHVGWGCIFLSVARAMKDRPNHNKGIVPTIDDNVVLS